MSEKIKKPNIGKVININNGDDYDVYIGRSGHGLNGYFGNPYKNGTRKENIDNFEKYVKLRISKDKKFKQEIKKLHGKTLGCFCKPKPCHGDVLVKISKELNLLEKIFEIEKE